VYVPLAGSVNVAALQLPTFTTLPKELRIWAHASTRRPTFFGGSWTTSPAWPVNV
jgi:hypothetical protein